MCVARIRYRGSVIWRACDALRFVAVRLFALFWYSFVVCLFQEVGVDEYWRKEFGRIVCVRPLVVNAVKIDWELAGLYVVCSWLID